MEQLKKQIEEGKLEKLYLLYGDERYLVQEYERRIRKALLAPEEELMNLDIWQGPQDPGDIRISLETLPFMAEKRLVIIKESGAFELKANKMAELAPDMATFPDTTTLLWIESKVDKRSKMFKAVKELGYAAEMKRLSDAALIKWIQILCRERKTRIDGNTASYFLSQTGNDMARILAETEKISSYVRGDQGLITREAIDAIVAPTIESSIFKLMDYLGNKQSAGAFRVYQELLGQNEKEDEILRRIIWHFRQLFRVSLMSGMNIKSVAKELGRADWQAEKLIGQARKFGRVQLGNLLRRLLDMDTQIKKSELSEKDAITLLILRYACA